MRLAVFGTSSNPFCLHHGECIRWLVEEAKTDLVLVVPSAAHALKTDLPPFEHRLAIARIGVQQLEASLARRTLVSPLESELAEAGGPVYAYDLLRAVREHWGEQYTDIKFSIGPDIPAELSRWRYVAEIESEFGFVHTPSFGVHATEVRRRIRTGDPRWKDLVSPGVADYIERYPAIYSGTMPAPPAHADG